MICDLRIAEFDDIVLRDYEEGYVVGEREFFLKETVQFCVKAKTFVQVAYISEEDFTRVLHKFPLDLEKYSYLRDRYIFGNGEDQGIMCEVCASTHQFKECPHSFVYFNRGRCINTICRSDENRRDRAHVRR